MLSFVVHLMLIGSAVNAHFLFKRHHHHHHFMIDMHGFHHGHSFQGGFNFEHSKHIPPPSPVYGPPPPVYGPPPPFPTHPLFPGFPNQQHHVGFGMINTMNPMPFNPWIPNIPNNPPNIFNTPFSNYPNQFGGATPPKTPNNNFDVSYQVPTLPTKVDAHPSFDVNTTPNSIDVEIATNPSRGNSFDFNANNRPNQNSGSTEATIPFAENPKTNQNNDSNYSGGDAFVPDNNFDINNQAATAIAPSVSEPTTDASSSQGKNGLEYDIDIRFNGPNDNRPNQKPLNRS